MQNFNPLSHLRSTQALRATMSDNPYHNQHIAEFTACMDDALTAMNQNNLSVFTAMLERIEALEKRVEQLEQAKIQSPEVEGVVKLNEKSVKDVKKKLMNLFRW